MRRRTFLKLLASVGGGSLLCSCGRGSRASVKGGRRVLVLAFDGLDPRILHGLMEEGRAPNFARVARRGGFSPIATTAPPITPVAFSTIISGCDPGVHNIFDFVHRDPNPADSPLAVEPYFSLAAAEPPEDDRGIPLGRWRLPLSSGTTRCLRRGPAFWEPLVGDGRAVDVLHLPATYPPPTPAGEGYFRCLSGMGTPDLLGTYGEFTIFASDAPPEGRKVDGGRFIHVDMREHSADASIEGPPNFLLKPGAADAAPLRAPLRMSRDPEHDVAKIELGDAMLLLNRGEWSDWVIVTFETGIPGSTVLSALQAPTSISGMARFYLKQVHPEFRLYVSPVNIDPRAPSNPVSTPEAFSGEMAADVGPFYTAGIPEDTKALSRGALNEDEFLAQADLAHTEKAEEFRRALSEFSSGCLFSYFGASDLVQHMFWRDRDPTHPGRIPEQGDRYAHVIDDLYAHMDTIVGEGLAALRGDDVLIVLSDHGFTSFRREFSVNTWLLEQGHLAVVGGGAAGESHKFSDVDWARTRAYAMGLNGLFLNMKGREKCGAVSEGEREFLVARLRAQLRAARDDDGQSVVDDVYDVRKHYPDADPNVAPDLIIGYAEGYRSSWATVLGDMPRRVLRDNHDRWSGTHCIAQSLMPGVFLATERIEAANPSLIDVAPTILAAFDARPPVEMKGRNLFEAT
jgi:predicted AlkP superfamily phosphohydrolase/phosphomutase